MAGNYVPKWPGIVAQTGRELWPSWPVAMTFCNKSAALRKRQAGNTPEVIAYADRANERLRRKYYKMVLSKSKRTNVAKTAVARELSCFIWGMMTNRIA